MMANADDGYTLLELLVVICIAGVLSAGLALSLQGAFSESRLDRTAAKLNTQFARVAAIARETGRDQTVYVRRTDRATSLVFGTTVIVIERPLAAEWVAAAEAGSDGDVGIIVMFGAGGSSGGTLELTDGVSKRALTIDWLTGEAAMVEGRL